MLNMLLIKNKLQILKDKIKIYKENSDNMVMLLVNINKLLPF